MFTYSPLSREKRETRFFRFSSACQPGSHLISLQLRHASLDDDALQYRALSYVWGDSKGQVDIEVNGKQFSVGENLHAFLQMLQHHDVESWLWADAICIQQSDDDEKSWHVQSMCDIFKNAELVYSWLGSGSKETDVAMEFFADWGPRAVKLAVMEKLWPTDFPMDDSFILSHNVSLYLQSLTRFFLPEPVFDKGGTNEDGSSEAWEGCDYDMARFFYDLLHVEGLRGTRSKSVLSDLETGIAHLLTNQYWQRIWIFQEVALAREVHLMCGEKLIPISYFEAVLEALWKFRAPGGALTPFLNDCPLRRGFCERFPSHLYPNKAMLTRQLLCRGTKVSLGSLLVAFSNQTERPWYRATDPRDIVYGILGLLSNEDRHPFGHVDYKNMTWVDLFTQATRSLIKRSLTTWMTVTGDALYNIGRCLPRPRDQPSELPSWVPDWRDVGVNGLPQGLRSFSSPHPDAGDTKMQPYHTYIDIFRHENPSVIQLPGYRVDFVTDVMSYDYQAENFGERDRPSKWLARIRQFTGLPESSEIRNLEGEDYVWRLVMDCHGINFLRRLVMDCHGLKFFRPWLMDSSCKTEAACFIRRLMRQDYPDPQTLPDFLVKAIYTSGKSINPDDDTSCGATTLADKEAQKRFESVGWECAPDSISENDLRSFMDAITRLLFRRASSKNSTLFKTRKGMLGSGIGDIRPGDMVVILRNTHAPFILRPRQHDGDELAANRETFTFGGEAWVDGIMYGEFVDTEPSEEVFEIY